MCESVEGAELAAVSITAVAKFPFLHLDDKAVEFESVPVGKAVERVTRLVNPSAVPAAFTVLRAADDHDGVLSLRPLQGVLLPGEATDVLVSYTPRRVIPQHVVGRSEPLLRLHSISSADGAGLPKRTAVAAAP